MQKTVLVANHEESIVRTWTRWLRTGVSDQAEVQGFTSDVDLFDAIDGAEPDRQYMLVTGGRNRSTMMPRMNKAGDDLVAALRERLGERLKIAVIVTADPGQFSGRQGELRYEVIENAGVRFENSKLEMIEHARRFLADVPST